MTTQFVHAKIPLSFGTFTVDGNSKITLDNGTFDEPRPNAFSLPAASVEGGPSTSCPGSTPTCRASCYVKGLAKNAPDIYAMYAENARTLHEALNDYPDRFVESATVLGHWITDHCASGFRWHVSGDVWDLAHAHWIAHVAQISRVPMWIYTRMFDVVHALTTAENLVVNVSADQDNLCAALAVARRYGLRICYMSTRGEVPELAPGDVIFPDYALRGRDLDDPLESPWWRWLTHEQRAMVCPADFFGQSEAHRCGPCRKCLVQAL